MRTYCKRQIKEYQVIVSANGYESLWYRSGSKKACIDEAKRLKVDLPFYDYVLFREIISSEFDYEV